MTLMSWAFFWRFIVIALLIGVGNSWHEKSELWVVRWVGSSLISALYWGLALYWFTLRGRHDTEDPLVRYDDAR